MRKINFFLSLCCMLLLGVMNANAYVGDSITGRATWTIAVSSHCYEDANGIGYISAAIDGNTRSYWHSNWGGEGASGETNPGNLAETPEYFIVDMGEVKSIGGVGYRPRTDNGTTVNGNGALKDYKIYVSTEPFSTITTGATNEQKKAALELTAAMWEGTGLEWPNSEEKRWETTEAVQARYIMVVFLGSHGNPANKWANCSEFNVYTYAETAKFALNEKLTELSMAFASITVGDAPGYYSTTTRDAASKAISDGYTVYGNAEATAEEVNQAIADVEAAIVAFQPNPIVSGYYKLVSGYPGYYENQSVNKAIYTDGDKLVWGTVDDDDLAFYWTITVDGTNITVQNELTKTYIGNWVSDYFPMSETAVNVTFNYLGETQYNIITNSNSMHTGGHNNGEGISGTIVGWGGSANGASAWKLVPVESLPLAAALADAKAAAQTVIDNIAAEGISTELFYYSQTKIDAIKALIDAATPATDAEIQEAILALRKTSDLDLMNVPADGKYFFKNDGRVAGQYLGFTNGGVPNGSTTKATRSVWQLTKVGEGNSYTLQNVATGKYLQYANNANWSLTDNAVTMKLFPAPGSVYGKVAVGGSGNTEKMHLRNASPYQVMGWDATDAGGSHWTMETYVETTDLATAENTLKFENAPAIATVLGVSEDAYNGITYEQLFAGTTAPGLVYAAAADNYYRFTNTTRGRCIGYNANGQATGVETSSSDLSQIWRMVPSGNKFKLHAINLGENGYMPQVPGGGSSTATLVAETSAKDYYLEIVDASAGTFRITYGGGNDGINMEDSNNNYNVNKWGGENAVFTASIVESIEVSLAEAADGEAYATAYLPFAVTVPAEVKAYVGDATYAAGDSYISMTEATAVAAENGFVLKGTAAGTVTLTIGASEAAKTSAISGTLTGEAQNDNYLVLGYVDNVVGFYKWADAIAANKAFLNNTSGGAVKMLFGGEATAIENVEVESGNDAPLYDLSGRKVAAPQKGGIYIQNGKKVIF